MFKSVLALTLAFALGGFAQQKPPASAPPAVNGAQLKQDAEANPSSIDAQSTYIQYVASEARRNPANQEALFKSLRENYEGWAKKSPDSSVLQWSLGVVCQMMNDDAAATHFDAAVKIDPKFIPAYKGLAVAAASHNDSATNRRALLKIIELNPKDQGASYEYIRTFYHEDRAKFLSLANEFIAGHPDSPASAALLTEIADAQPDHAARVAYWEKLLKEDVRRANPMQGLTIPMRGLFEEYTVTDPAKAQAFAEEQAKLYPRIKQWAQVAEYQKNLIAAQGLINEKKYAEAQEKLEKLVVPAGFSPNDVEIAKANAQYGAGETEAAYAALLKAAGRRPTAQMEAAIKALGAKMGKSGDQVSADFWNSLTEKNNPMHDFELTDTKGQTVKLSSLRGKTILVHFWHPSCQACHVELPYLKLLAERFKSLQIVTINTVPEEEGRVAAWMSSYGFQTLEAPDKEWAKNEYNVAFNPTNFLLDGEGRIIFKTDLQTYETTDQAAHEVEFILAHTK